MVGKWTAFDWSLHMQFNQKVKIKYAVKWDAFNQPEDFNEDWLRCCVLDEQMRIDKESDTKRRLVYLTICVEARTWERYADRFQSEDIRIERNDLVFEPISVQGILGLNGLSRVYEVGLRQVTV